MYFAEFFSTLARYTDRKLALYIIQVIIFANIFSSVAQSQFRRTEFGFEKKTGESSRHKLRAGNVWQFEKKIETLVTYR